MTKRERTLRTLHGRAARRLGQAGVGALVVAGTLAGMTGVASAHHPTLSAGATAECGDESGTWVISGASQSWTTGSSGAHSNVQIWWAPAGTNWPASGAAPAGAHLADSGSYSSGNSYRFDFEFDVPGTTGVTGLEGGDVIELMSRAVGPWGNGSGGGQWSGYESGGSNDDPVLVELADDCAPPAEPSAAAQLDCAAGEIDLTFTGVGSSTTVDIRKDGVVVAEDHSVPVGSSATSIPLAAGDENDNVVIALDYAEGTDQELTVPVDCDDAAQPSAGFTLACASGTVLVSLTNDGDEPTTATITKDGVQQGGTIAVPAGTSPAVPVDVSGDENATVTITVTFATGDVDSQELLVDCDEPAPTIGTPTCAASGLDVTLGNVQGSEPATFTVVIDGVTTSVVVPAGGSQVVNIPVAEDATVSVLITSGTAELSNQSLTRDCEQPAASVELDCAEGGVVVELTNPGQQDAVVDVAGESVLVPAGTTAGDPVTRIIPVAEGDAYDVTVLGQTAEGTRDCEQPVATLTLDCAAGGVVVTVTNGGEVPTVVLVDGEAVEVEPGVPYTTTIPVAEGASYEVSVTGEDGLDESISGTRDCEAPAVQSAALDCAAGGVVVVLTNSGELPTTVTVDGADVVIPAGGETTVTVPVAENSAYSFLIEVDGSATQVSGERDCEQPALVSSSLDCAAGGVVVVLSNDGSVDTVVTVDGNPVLVPAGGSASTTVPVAENAAYDVLVLGDELEIQLTGTRDCEQPAVESALVDCATGGVVVTLTNGGLVETIVTVDGVAIAVPAGETVSHLVPVAENADYEITILGDQLERLVTGTVDCLLPEPVADEVVCAAGGMDVVLRNTGDDAATFVVTSPALPGGAAEAVLDAGAVDNVHIPLAEDASTTVVVTSGDEVIFDDTVTRDCETVLGNVAAPGSTATGGGSLPVTGADSKALAALAGALLLAGTCLVTGARRRDAVAIG